MRESSLRTAFFLSLLLGALVLVFFIVRPYLITLTLAATAAVILYPLYDRMREQMGGRDRLAAVLMVILTILLLLIPLSLLGVQIGTEAAGLYNDLRGGAVTLPADLLSRAEELVQQYLPGASVNLSEYAGRTLNWIASSLQAIFAETLRFVFLLFLGIIAYYFLLKDGRRFVGALIDLSPLRDREDRQLIDRLREAVNSVIRGSLIIAVLQGIASGIGFALFGIPSAVLLGSLAGVGALIPTLGTTIVFAPLLVYLLVIGSYWTALGLLIWGSVAVGLIDNFLHPILVGRGMHMHPLFIFLAVIGGVRLFGLAGFVLGPLAMSLLFGLLDIFRQERAG